jgi:hypothetical protein
MSRFLSSFVGAAKRVRKAKSNFVWLGVVLVFLSACDVSDPKTDPPKVVDTASSVVAQPTDTHLLGTNARLLTSEKFFKFIDDTIVGGTDWYRLGLSKDSTYAIITGYRGYVSKVTILSSTRNTVLATSDSGKGYVVYKASSDSIVRVKVTGTDSTKPLRYRILVMPFDGYEPNDVQSKATLLPTDSTVLKMFWFDLGPENIRDVDWVKMRTEIGKVYELNEFQADTLLLLDGAGRNVSYSSSTGRIGFAATDTITYAKVAGTVNPAGGSYFTIPRNVAAVKPPNDRFEPDGGFAIAHEISTDSSVEGHLISIGDVDVVKIPTTIGKLYRVSLDVSKANLEFKFFGKDTAQAVPSWGTGPRWSRTFRAREDGYTYIQFRSSYYRMAYSLSVKELPDDANEPEGLTHGISIAKGDVKFRYMGSGDEDWFRFSADSGKTYVFGHPYREPNSMLGSVWNLDSTPVRASLVEMAQDSGGGIFYCTKAGVYGYRVTGGDSGGYTTKLDERNSQPAWYDALEPDDGMKSASTLVPDSSVSRHQLHRGDTDWVEIAMDSGLTYAIGAKGGCSYWVYSADSVALGRNGFVRDGSAGFVTLTPRTKSSAFIAMTGFALPSSCDLRSWRLASGGAAAKGVSTAKEIPLDNIPRSYVLNGEDNWVKVHLGSLEDGRLYELSLGNLGTSASLSLGIYRADSLELQAGTRLIVRPGEQHTRNFYGYASGDYYLNVARYESLDTTPVSFTLAAMADVVDSFENDNTLKSAKSITVDGPSQARLLNWKDQDWISFQADSGVGYLVSALITDDAGGGYMYLNQSLYNSDSTLLGQISTPERPYDFWCSKSGTYYMKIETQSSTYMPYHYVLSVVTHPPLFPKD